MERSYRWGALLVAGLPALGVAACSGATPPPEAAPPLPPSSAPSAPVEAEPPAPAEIVGPAAEAKLSPLARLPGQDVLAGPGSGGVDPRQGQEQPQRVRYGRGELVVRYFLPRSVAPACPLAGAPPGCALFALTSSVELPSDADWNSGSSLAPEAPEPGRWQQAPHPWRAFAGTRRAVYALGAATIDRIDEQGRVMVFVDDQAVKGWQSLWAFERGDETLLISHRDGEQMRLHDVSPPASPGAARRLGDHRKLTMSPLPDHRTPDARAARYTQHSGGAVMMGEPRFVALPDEGEQKNRWAMAWLEIVPPEKGTPRGAPPASPARQPGATPGKASKAKHGCGRPSHGPSRPLSDPSVEKKAHITRFAGVNQIDDTIAWTNNDLDPDTTQLEARLDGGRVQVKAVAADKSTRRFVGEPRGYNPAPRHAVHLSRDEELADAVFDHEAKEGLVAVWSGQRLYHRRFDADANFLGEAVAYPHDNLRAPPGPSKMWLRRVQGRWFALLGNQLLALTDGAPPLPVPHPDHDPQGLAALDDKPAVITRTADAVFAASVDPASRKVGRPRRLASLSRSRDYPHDLQVIQPPGSSPLILAYERWWQEHRASRLGWVSVKAGGAWKWSSERQRRALDDLLFYPTASDIVVVERGPESLLITWLLAGKADEVRLARRGGDDGDPQPLLVPPAQPGPVQPQAELAGIERECPRLLLTGGAAPLLVCASGTDATTPGIKVSLRRASLKDAPKP